MVPLIKKEKSTAFMSRILTGFFQELHYISTICISDTILNGKVWSTPMIKCSYMKKRSRWPFLWFSSNSDFCQRSRWKRNFWRIIQMNSTIPKSSLSRRSLLKTTTCYACVMLRYDESLDISGALPWWPWDAFISLATHLIEFIFIVIDDSRKKNTFGMVNEGRTL